MKSLKKGLICTLLYHIREEKASVFLSDFGGFLVKSGLQLTMEFKSYISALFYLSETLTFTKELRPALREDLEQNLIDLSLEAARDTNCPYFKLYAECLRSFGFDKRGTPKELIKRKTGKFSFAQKLDLNDVLKIPEKYVATNVGGNFTYFETIEKKDSFDCEWGSFDVRTFFERGSELTPLALKHLNSQPTAPVGNVYIIIDFYNVKMDLINRDNNFMEYVVNKVREMMIL